MHGIEPDVTTSATTRLGALGVRTLGSGPPAVLWHSLFVDSSTWRGIPDELARHRRLVIVDGPSHGSSEPLARRFTLDECAGAALDVLRHLGIDEPVDWVGNAWGGHVGVVFAATEPERCRSLVTIGTPIHALTAPERVKVLALLPLYRLLGPVPPVVKAVTDALLGSGAHPHDAALLGAAFRRGDRAAMFDAVRSLALGRPDLAPTLARVTAPTLLLAAADDEGWSPGAAVAASRLASRGASVTVPGAGHVAPLLQAAPAVVELVTAFWADPDRVLDQAAATVSAQVQGVAEIAAGAWTHNPVTGELGRITVGPADTAGRRIEGELWLQPGAAVAGGHVHDHLVERFELLAGEVSFEIAGVERVARPGAGTLEVPAGVVHDWWNSGDGIAHVRVEVEAAPSAPGRPAARFVSMLEALWSLGALGRVNAKGMPDPLWLAAIAREYRDTLRFTRPPAFVQAALFGPLAALARRTGRDPLSPELHGPAAACAIPEPSDARLAELLARPVAARTARRRGGPARRL